jgi:hypothetical protein
MRRSSGCKDPRYYFATCIRQTAISADPWPIPAGHALPVLLKTTHTKGMSRKMDLAESSNSRYVSRKGCAPPYRRLGIQD